MFPVFWSWGNLVLRIEFNIDSEKKWIPDGFHFLGIEEAKNRRLTINKIHHFFEKSSFKEVIPPAFDFTSSFQNHVSESDKNKIFKVRDASGYEISPSLDLTIQVVKGLSGLVPEGEFPKVYYIGKTIKESDGLTISRRETTQAGAELIGSSDGTAFQEIFTMIDGLLKEVGYKNGITIVLGNMNVMLSLLDRLDLDLKTLNSIIPLIYSKNITELKKILKSIHNEELKDALLRLLLDFEEISIFEFLRSINFKYSLALESTIEETEALLAFSKNKLKNIDICIDYSLFRDLDYYTGFIFQGYGKTEFTPLVTGGAYDTLFEKFSKTGRKASGFAFNIDVLEDLLQNNR